LIADLALFLAGSSVSMSWMLSTQATAALSLTDKEVIAVLSVQGASILHCDQTIIENERRVDRR
jgi:hypothetical protein